MGSVTGALVVLTVVIGRDEAGRSGGGRERRGGKTRSGDRRGEQLEGFAGDVRHLVSFCGEVNQDGGIVGLDEAVVFVI